MRSLVGIALGVLALLSAIEGTASASHVRPTGATPMYLPLVPAHQLCTTPNVTHGPPLSFASCRPPVQASRYLTFGTPDANGAAPSATGHVRLDAYSNSGIGDVIVHLELTDVRCRPATDSSVCASANAQDGPDYTGDLLAQFFNRQVDHYNGPTLTDAATMVDIPFPVPAPCHSTATTSAGGVCAVATSFNATIPGAVQDQHRAIWQLDQVYVYDGGPDGDDQTAGNDTFAIQGLFVP